MSWETGQTSESLENQNKLLQDKQSRPNFVGIRESLKILKKGSEVIRAMCNLMVD